MDCVLNESLYYGYCVLTYNYPYVRNASRIVTKTNGIPLILKGELLVNFLSDHKKLMIYSFE